MGTVRVATVNGEWMNDWFTADAAAAAFKATFARDGESGDTSQAAGRLAAMIRAIDPDVMALVEAPSRRAELELFVAEYLSSGGHPDYTVLLGDSGGAQKLALLAKPDQATITLAPSTDVTELVTPWMADVDGDAVLDEYQFTRTPLCCYADLDGTRLQVIVAHLKSNFVNQGQQMWADPATRPNYIRAALTNRRRIANEAMRIRRHLERRITADPGAAVIVLGDLNDGPGQDYFEQLYLAHNVTDILVGSPYRPEHLFHHAQSDVPEPDRYTAVFDDFVTDTPNARLLLDHILLSPVMTDGAGPIQQVPGSGTIAHAAWTAQIDGDGLRRDQRPTDHRPATVTLEVS